MTEDERKAEHAKQMAASVFHQMEAALIAENFVRKVCQRHQDNPAFEQYMRGMLLEDRLKKFLSREPI